MPKVELPHPGTSYNPDYDDHQDLLMRAHLVELKKLKEEEEKLMRKLTVSVRKMSWAELEVNSFFLLSHYKNLCETLVSGCDSNRVCIFSELLLEGLCDFKEKRTCYCRFDMTRLLFY